MTQQATPGPWRMCTSNSYRRISSDATGKDGDVLCAVVQRSDGHPDLHFSNGGFEGPDARLMLAAPDLLAAAQPLLDDDSPLWPWVNEKNIGRDEYDRRCLVIASLEAAISRAGEA